MFDSPILHISGVDAALSRPIANPLRVASLLLG